MAALIRTELLERLIREVVPGPSGGSTIAILGVGGIGKSTLLASVVDVVAAQGVRVLRSHSSERTVHEPFAAVSALIQGRPADPVSAAIETVDGWCSEGPMLVWVDDAHHLDAASFRVLTRIARLSRDLPLTLLVSARPHHQSPELSRLLELCSTRVDLGPLSDADLVNMAEHELGATPGPGLQAQLAVTRGNPFAIGVLLGVLDQRRALIRDGDVVEIDADGSEIPESVAAAVRTFIALLPADTRDLLAVIAVLGTPALPEDVAALSDRPLVSLGATLAYAVNAGVLRWVAASLTFTHDLFPEVLEAELPEALRTAMHRRAVQVLQARGAPATQVAEHAWRGGDVKDASLVRSVATGLDAYAPGVAAELLAHVQPLIAAEETDEMVADRADSLIRAGRGRDAEDLISAYLPRATSPVQRSRLNRLALTSMVYRAHATVVHAQVDNRLARGDLPPQTRLQLLALRGWVLALEGHLTAADDVTRELEELERQVEEIRPAAEYHVAPVRATLAWLHGRPQDALRMEQAEAGLRAANPARTANHMDPARRPLYVLYAQGPTAAETDNARARVLSAQGDFSYVESLHDFVLGNIHFISGRWEDAAAAIDAGLEIGEETGSMGLAAPLGLRALMDAHRGRFEDARARLARLAKKQYPPQMGRDYARLAAVYLAETEGVSSVTSEPGFAWEEAFKTAVGAARDLWRDAVERGGEFWIASIAGYTVRIGDDALRRSIVEVLRELSTDQMPVLDPIRGQVLGMHARDHAAVAAAGERFAKASYPLAAGFAWEEAGLLAARSGASSVATRALRDAVRVYDRLGALSDQDRLRARAKRLGIRTARPRARRDATTGWEALTPTENTVADLVRVGLTNPEIASRLFLSPRTVQTHVSHILQKTQLHSRVEIAAARA